jgi:hypothetical protein
VAGCAIAFAALLGSLTAVANCGSAAIAASTGQRSSIRAFNTGQAAAVLLTSLLSVFYDLVTPPSDSEAVSTSSDQSTSSTSSDYYSSPPPPPRPPPAFDKRPHFKELADHAAATFFATAFLLLATLFAFRSVLPASRRAAADAEAAQLLADGEFGEEGERSGGSRGRADDELPQMDHYLSGLNEELLASDDFDGPALLEPSSAMVDAEKRDPESLAYDLRLYKLARPSLSSHPVRIL